MIPAGLYDDEWTVVRPKQYRAAPEPQPEKVSTWIGVRRGRAGRTEYMRIPAYRALEEMPPPMPACFDELADWLAWCRAALESGAPVVRRINIRVAAADGRGTVGSSAWAPGDPAELPVCDDCSQQRRALMEAQGRCWRAASSSRPAQELRAASASGG